LDVSGKVGRYVIGEEAISAPSEPHRKVSNMPTTTKRLRYARGTAAQVLDISARTARRYEEQGLLTPIKPSGKNGPVYYSAEEVEGLAEGTKTPVKKGRA
jgi:hypothetical protein